MLTPRIPAHPHKPMGFGDEGIAKCVARFPTETEAPRYAEGLWTRGGPRMFNSSKTTRIPPLHLKRRYEHGTTRRRTLFTRADRYLDCRIDGKRHVAKRGKHIKRSVASELADVKRAAILKGEAGIGKKKKDCTFDKATEAYLTWMTTNCRPRTQRVYQQQLDQLSLSFAGKLLSQISSFDIERHKHRRVEAGARVVANREVSRLRALFNAALKWELYEGKNPAVGMRSKSQRGDCGFSTMPRKRPC
jgi:hypothetical protein